MLNEPPEFIERWAKSAIDADDLVLIDTGSTNEAVECAKDLGVAVYGICVRPFRFDVARNTGLALLDPAIDYVVKLDVDEVLRPGWRDTLERHAGAARYAYRYIWNWRGDQPNIEFHANHVHSRHGWRWQHPVHEDLVGGDTEPAFLPGFVIEHRADDQKSRGQYLPLLELACREDPTNDRMSHYYGRELYFRGDYVRARAELVRHLSLPSAQWPAERAQSYRYLAKMDDYPERWLLRAAAEAPYRREPWIDLALLHRNSPDIAEGFVARAKAIRTKHLDYMTEPHAWDDQFLQAIVEE